MYCQPVGAHLLISSSGFVDFCPQACSSLQVISEVTNNVNVWYPGGHSIKDATTYTGQHEHRKTHMNAHSRSGILTHNPTVLARTVVTFCYFQLVDLLY